SLLLSASQSRDEEVRTVLFVAGGFGEISRRSRRWRKWALRHLPQSADVSDPRRDRAHHRIRWTRDAGIRRSGKVSEQPGNAALFEEQIDLRDRSGAAEDRRDAHGCGGRGLHRRGDGASVWRVQRRL